MNTSTLKKQLKLFVDRYLIKGLSGMAVGLFSTLIVGLIIKQIGLMLGATSTIGNILIQISAIATVLTGAGIALGTAYALKVPNLIMAASAVTGIICAYSSSFLSGTLFGEGGAILLKGPGDPLSAFIGAVIGIECARLISGKTSLDIIISPMVTILLGSAAGLLIGPEITGFMTMLGELIVKATELQPLLMGAFVSALMGIVLTLPISSAAISIILGLSGLAAGAATVGCSTQMIGFAIASYRENGMRGFVAQGLGTSMLQIGNIVRNPRVWIPPTLASFLLGPLSTLVFKMENNAAGGGMGTSGLVGPLMTWQTMIQNESPIILFIKIVLMYFVLPAIFTLAISEFMRKKNWIKKDDMKLDL